VKDAETVQHNNNNVRGESLTRPFLFPLIFNFNILILKNQEEK